MTKFLSVVICIRNLMDCAKKNHDAGVSAQLLASYSSIKGEDKGKEIYHATMSDRVCIVCRHFG